MKWHWQYTAPPLLVGLSVDWVLMPLIRFLGIKGWEFFVIIAILATIELPAWFLFWRWFCRVPVIEFAKIAAEKNYVKEAVKLGKEIEAELKIAGIWEKIKNKIINYLFNTFRKATDENNKFVKMIKSGRHWAMFFLGAEPYSGGRVFGVILCGSADWKNGLYSLAAGNLIRVAYTIGIFNYVISLFQK